MNNRSSGRRRGRSSRTPNRGPNDGNRQNSRNPGNAHQLCEKYKNMARDAHQQGDRVMNEYYLQFADHYFRILAEANNRKEEQQREREETKKPKAEKDDGADERADENQDDGRKRSSRGSPKNDDTAEAEDKPKRRGRPPKKEQANGAADDGHSNGAETIEADRLPGAISIGGDDAGEDKPKRKSPSRSRAAKSGDDDAAAA